MRPVSGTVRGAVSGHDVRACVGATRQRTAGSEAEMRTVGETGASWGVCSSPFAHPCRTKRAGRPPHACAHFHCQAEMAVCPLIVWCCFGRFSRLFGVGVRWE